MDSQWSEESASREIGNYLLGRTVGEGAFGVVKRGTHLPTGERVAVKVMVKAKIREVADVERVAREMHILRIVYHPSILQLYEIIETQKYLFLITEHIEQGELFEYVVGQGQLQEERACSLFSQLITGIRYLRDLRISHRDLKLENILLDSQLRLKIIDFGLSNTYAEGEQLKTACGSPCYAAPEMIAGTIYNGTEVDIWSAGVILFAMVCGSLPFEDPDIHQLYKKIKEGSIYFPETVSEPFKDLINGLLEVDPKRRYTIEEIQEHPWYKAADKEIPSLGIKVGSQVIKADPLVLNELNKLGFDTKHAKSSIEVNKHGPDLAAYYLQLKKMRREGYESEYDIHSVSFKYAVADSDQNSFQNTRKSYYFGVHEKSPLKQKRGKSGKRGKFSPAKSEMEVKRKKKIRGFTLTESKQEFSASKICRASGKKPIRTKLELPSSKKLKRNGHLKSVQIGESPIRKPNCSVLVKKGEFSVSGKKKCVWREKKSRSCSLIERFH